ncbi:hypothetical protein LN543_21750 [Xanthomonas hortorum pv. gardneri]|nr:hypothetical protein [Xanthomonas hortorum pv. gardneri]
MNLPQRMSHAEALGCQILLEDQLFAASCDRQPIDRRNSNTMQVLWIALEARFGTQHHGHICRRRGERLRASAVFVPARQILALSSGIASCLHRAVSAVAWASLTG